MSLNGSQKEATRRELQANFKLSRVTPDQAAGELGFSPGQLEDALELQPSVDPACVWRLRDYVEEKVRADGGVPVPFTVLTESARSSAAIWLGVGPGSQA